MARKQESQELIGFKHMALWLLAYKLYRDYFDIVNTGRAIEPEQFFDDWSTYCMMHMQGPVKYSKEDRNCVWILFLKLLVTRVETLK